MNERILLEEGVIRESLGAAYGGLNRPRSLDELKARVYTLFRRIDQEVVQQAGLCAGTRVERDPAVQWPQRSAISSLI